MLTTMYSINMTGLLPNGGMRSGPAKYFALTLVIRTTWIYISMLLLMTGKIR